MEIREAAPKPLNMPKAMHTSIKGKATVMPVMAICPMPWPTKIRSMM